MAQPNGLLTKEDLEMSQVLSTVSNSNLPSNYCRIDGVFHQTCHLIGPVGTRVIIEGSIDPIQQNWFPVCELLIGSGETQLYDQRMIFGLFIRYRFVASTGDATTLPTLNQVPSGAILHLLVQ